MIGFAMEKLKESEKLRMSSGADAYYFHLDAEWGFKFYKNPEYGKLAYLAQKTAHKHGIGPATGHYRKFNLWGERYEGYVTQRVETVYEYLKRKNIWNTENWWNWPATRECISKFTSLFGPPRDDGSGNLGMMGKRVVYVDFGEVGWYSYIAKHPREFMRPRFQFD